MAIATQSEIRLRLEALLATIPEIETVIVETADEEGGDLSPTADMLPAAIVFSRAATRAGSAAGRSSTTRTWEIGVLIDRLDTWTPAELRAHQLAAEDFLEVVPNFFRKVDRLRLTGQTDLKGVLEVGEMTDDGVEIREYGDDTDGLGNSYYAVTYRMTIEIMRER